MGAVQRFIRVLFLAAVGMVIAPAGAQVWAQDYPTRPITILVGLAPGGVTDVMARLYAQKVSAILGQSVIVENRPVASGAVAAAALQKAEPDGYMLLVFSGAQHATVPAMSDTAIYDPVKGAEPIGVIFNFAGAVAVPADSPAKTIADLVALSKSKPDGLNFGSPGVGTPSHLSAAKLIAATGMKAQFIHYKGGAPMMTDLVAGRLDVAWPSAPASRAFLEAGKIKALAIDGDRRWKLVPQVPTLKEAGFGDVGVANWFAVAAAPGTPRPVITKLSNAFADAGRDPDLLRRVEEQGLTVATSSPAELGQAMSKEAADIRALISKLNLRQQK
ncbi:MAG: tripartite tricarboxylate transporter substrate binding protein [Pseudolabrys sp.]|nr:tripartite tricarboxylate transporter substrate binding protein [Pseudolabrys sp.]MDP2294685.1 tripartite tricarboxylate transporter substrate binding protein [Pseudolabrys sp.]